MTEACIGVEALVIVILLAALLWGQPAAAQVDRAQLSAQATRIAALSTQLALLSPTPRACRMSGTSYQVPPRC